MRASMYEDGPTSPIATERIGRARGLPSIQVHSVCADRTGRIWFAGPGGLTAHDGDRLRTIARSDGLATHGLRALAADHLGGLWIGHDVGIDYLAPDGRVDRPPCDGGAGWHEGVIDRIVVDGGGQVFAAGATGVIRRGSSSAWTRIGGPSGDQPVRMLELDASGRVWAADLGGIGCWDGTSWERPKVDSWRAVGTVTALAALRDGTLLIGGEHGWIRSDRYGAPAGRLHPDGRVCSLFADSTGDAWIALADELRHIPLAAIGTDAAVHDSSVRGISVNSMCEDRFGNLWIATESAGVVKVSGLRHAICSVGACPSTMAIVEDGADMLVGTEKGAFRLEPERDMNGCRSDPLTEIGNLADARVWDLGRTHDGRLLALTQTGVLDVTAADSHRLEGSEVLTAPARAMLRLEHATLIGSTRGLCRVDDDGVSEIVAPDGPLGYVYTLTSGADGDVWVGTLGRGLWRLSGDRLDRVDRIVADGLIEIGNTTSVGLDRDGTIVVLQDERVVVLQPSATGPASRVLWRSDGSVSGWSAACGGDGTVWVGGPTGLRQHDLRTGDCLREINARFGVDAWEFTTSRSLRISANGILWCGVSGGLISVDPRLLPGRDIAPTVHLTGAHWTNASVTGQDGHLVVDEGRWTLRVEARTTWYIDEDQILYSFRVLGFDEHWTSTRIGSFTCTSLPPGTYTVQARAASPLVGIGQPVDLLTLHVRRARRRPARIVSSIAARPRRARRLRAEKLALEQRVRERTVELQNTTAELARANSELERLSLTDPLTGVANRRALDDVLHREVTRSLRTSRPLSIALFDIDDFKAFNDQYGHPEGDRCLRAVAAAVHEQLRGTGDTIARYGGEEFCLVLADTGLNDAFGIGHRVNATVNKLLIPHRRSSTGPYVSVSIGIVTFEPAAVRTTDVASDSIAAALIRSADLRLYEAKLAGRNRCEAGALVEPIDTGK